MWGVIACAAISAYAANGGKLRFPSQEEIYERDRAQLLRAETRKTLWLNLSLVVWVMTAAIIGAGLLIGVF